MQHLSSSRRRKQAAVVNIFLSAALCPAVRCATQSQLADSQDCLVIGRELSGSDGLWCWCIYLLCADRKLFLHPDWLGVITVASLALFNRVKLGRVCLLVRWDVHVDERKTFPNLGWHWRLGKRSCSLLHYKYTEMKLHFLWGEVCCTVALSVDSSPSATLGSLFFIKSCSVHVDIITLQKKQKIHPKKSGNVAMQIMPRWMCSQQEINTFRQRLIMFFFCLSVCFCFIWCVYSDLIVHLYKRTVVSCELRNTLQHHFHTGSKSIQMTKWIYIKRIQWVANPINLHFIHSRAQKTYQKMKMDKWATLRK